MLVIVAGNLTRDTDSIMHRIISFFNEINESQSQP